MARLGISQVPGSNPPEFLARNRDTEKTAPPAKIPSPYEWPVPNTGDEKLMTQLRWYLETFLSYPFEPYTIRAGHIEAALKSWGEAAFKALFDNLAAGKWIPHQADAVLDVLITCDDPRFLAWPWEALYFSELGYFGHRARIQRRLSYEIPDPPDLPELPRDRIRILLVTARPYDDDVDYRSISRPLVDLIRREKLPVSVQVLRPPTLENLRRHLMEEKPGHYHILHFDGHGGYGTSAPDPASGQFHGNEGRLMFEEEDGSQDEVTAARLSTALQGCTVPFVVLNACRSAQLDANAAEGRAFASVAGALVHAGFRGVLAMAYNLTVTGAQQFLPAFYRRLFKSGNLLEAAREGRLRMFDHASRSAWNPKVKLQDWLLPVVYQQTEDFDLRFAGALPAPEPAIPLPEEAKMLETFTFVGRDSAIHAIERALRRPAAGILIHGLGGVGKTTLARHFLQWLRDTGGLEVPPIWLSFDDIHSAAYVLNTIGRQIFGGGFDCDQAQHYEALIAALRDQVALFMVWDNFESARGFQPDHEGGLLTPADQDRLRSFLAALREGKTKALITSRSDEAWLPPEHCRRLSLGGLRGEELWEFAAQVLDDLDLPVNRNDQDLLDLLSDLEGHPVLIRAVLPELKTQSAATLRQHWQANLPRFLAQGNAPARARLLASLDLAGASFTAEERPYLIPLALHQRFVALNNLHPMGKQHVLGYQPARMEQVIARLVRGGLLTGLEQNVFALHPLLTSYLKNTSITTVPDNSGPPNATAIKTWERAFVDVMSSLANAVAPKPLQEQRGMFAVHRANFRRAVELAVMHGMQQHFGALTQALAIYAMLTHDWSDGFALFERLADSHRNARNAEGEASAYHQLGIIAQRQRDFLSAERWFFKSLAISEERGIEHCAARTYHHLGVVSQERRDFPTAERWHLKSLAISEKRGDERSAAMNFQQLGVVSQERRDFPTAERWYLKSLAVKEKQGDEDGAAFTYHSLGFIFQERRDFPAAERWYIKSLTIREKRGDDYGAASTYHNLGFIAQERRDFPAAERWYLKSLAIKEKQRDEHGAAITYNQLGIIAQLQHDLPTAERWHLKSLTIKEKQGDEHGAALTYHNLGAIAQERCDLPAAERWYLKSLTIKERLGDEHGAASGYHQLATIAQERRDFPAAERLHLKSLAIKVKQGDEHGAATTYAQLGKMAKDCGNHFQAGALFLQAARTFASKGDKHYEGVALDEFAHVFETSDVDVRAQLRTIGCEALGEELMQRIEQASKGEQARPRDAT